MTAYIMEKTITINKQIDPLLEIFPKIILEEKSMKLKSAKGTKFEIMSSDNFGNFSMIEKEHFYVSCQFTDSGEHTQLKYNIRANATFKTLTFVIPLMAFPTLMMSMKSGGTSFLINLLIFVILSCLSTVISLHYDKKMRLKGERSFNNLIKKIQ